MKFRGIKGFFGWLRDNPHYIALAGAASILSNFNFVEEGVTRLIGLLGIGWVPLPLVKIITMGLFLAILGGLFSIIGHYINKRSRQRLGVYDKSVRTILWRDPSGERIREFQELRAQARSSMLVMGIGMTYFSQDLQLLKQLLDENLVVRLLMIDPDVIVESVDSSNPTKTTRIRASFFDRYFDRNGYSTDVRTSFSRLVGFIETRKGQLHKKGRVHLKKYPYRIPMNITIIDETAVNHAGRMLMEWCLPFSTWRLSTRLSRDHDEKKMFDIVQKNLEELWHISKTAANDAEDSLGEPRGGPTRNTLVSRMRRVIKKWVSGESSKSPSL